MTDDVEYIPFPLFLRRPDNMTEAERAQRRRQIADMAISTPLTGPGQIRQGDRLRLIYKGRSMEYVAERVRFPGTELEEVIVDTRANKYFIVSMALDGSSWAKQVSVLKDAGGAGVECG